MKIHFKNTASDFQVNVMEGSGSQVITQVVGNHEPQNSINRHLEDIHKAITALNPDEQAELLAAFDDLSSQAAEPKSLLEKAQGFYRLLCDGAHDYTAVRTPVQDLITWLAATLPS